MTRSSLVLSLTVAGCAALAVSAPLAAPRAGGGAAPKPLRAAADTASLPRRVVEELTSFANPGPPHRGFEYFAGRWTTRTRAWADPDAKPAEFAGGAEYRTILGGRFLQLESRAQVGDVESHGLGFYGYDNFKEKYSFYFIHDGDTQALAGFGASDPPGRQITFEVPMDMPTTGEHARPMRAVLRQLGPDRHAFEMFEKQADGRDWKVLEIAYERVK